MEMSSGLLMLRIRGSSDSRITCPIFFLLHHAQHSCIISATGISSASSADLLLDTLIASEIFDNKCCVRSCSIVPSPFASFNFSALNTSGSTGISRSLNRTLISPELVDSIYQTLDCDLRFVFHNSAQSVSHSDRKCLDRKHLLLDRDRFDRSRLCPVSRDLAFFLDGGATGGSAMLLPERLGAISSLLPAIFLPSPNRSVFTGAKSKPAHLNFRESLLPTKTAQTPPVLVAPRQQYSAINTYAASSSLSLLQQQPSSPFRSSLGLPYCLKPATQRANMTKHKVRDTLKSKDSPQPSRQTLLPPKENIQTRARSQQTICHCIYPFSTSVSPDLNPSAATLDVEGISFTIVGGVTSAVPFSTSASNVTPFDLSASCPQSSNTALQDKYQQISSKIHATAAQTSSVQYVNIIAANCLQPSAHFLPVKLLLNIEPTQHQPHHGQPSMIITSKLL
nr:hypothetical protein Iba_chr13aCG13240 [Ipomoea batatas]